MKTVWEQITDFVLGTKYYANIINTIGTDKCEICCFIFHTKDEAEAHKMTLATTRSFMWVETISFRSRKEYQ